MLQAVTTAFFGPGCLTGGTNQLNEVISSMNMNRIRSSNCLLERSLIVGSCHALHVPYHSLVVSPWRDVKLCVRNDCQLAQHPVLTEWTLDTCFQLF